MGSLHPLRLMQKIISYTFLSRFRIISTNENRFSSMFKVFTKKVKKHSQKVYFVKNKTLKSLKLGCQASNNRKRFPGFCDSFFTLFFREQQICVESIPHIKSHLNEWMWLVQCFYKAGQSTDQSVLLHLQLTDACGHTKKTKESVSWCCRIDSRMNKLLYISVCPS